jgi:hypothetical protein
MERWIERGENEAEIKRGGRKRQKDIRGNAPKIWIGKGCWR